MRKAAISLSILLATYSAALACPNCKDQIAHSDAQEAQAVPAGFNYSIYSMLGGLFITSAFFGRFIYKAIRDTDRRNV
jgi:hypothetical protein